MSLKGGAIAICAAAVCVSGCAQWTALEPARSRDYADFLIARVANMTGDFETASQRYDAALAQSSQDSELLSGALTAALATGDVARARDLARLAPEGADAPPLAHLVRAAETLAASRYAAAEREIEDMDGGPTEELTARFLKTWALAGAGRPDEGLLQLDQLANVRPYGALLAYQQAMALDYAGQNTEALAAYTQGAAGRLWVAPATERHADLLARTGARTEAEALLSGSQSRNDSEALQRALTRLQEGGRVAQTSLTPARGAAISLFGLGAIFLQEDDNTRGLATMTLALMLDPQLDPARLNFAQAQSEMHHPAEARAALARVPATSPYFENAQIMIAWVLKDEGREDEALALARQLASNGGERARRTLADLNRSLHHYEEADALYSELIGEGSDEWRLYFSRAAVREQLNRWPEAEADLQHALTLSPEQPDVLNFLGYMWIDRGERLQEGLAMVQRAVELRPSSAAIIDSLGWAYYQLGDYDKALEQLERAVELEPADATLNDHLGDLYWRLERYTEARFQWRRALSLEPDDANAIEAKIESGLAPTRSATR